MANTMQEKEFHSDVFDKQTWQKVFAMLMEHKRAVVWMMVFNVALALTDVMMPMLNRYAINTYVEGMQGKDTLWLFALAFVSLVLIQCVLLYLFFRYAAYVESVFAAQLRKRCFVKLQEQTFAYFDKTANGWLMARITSDTARLAETLTWAFVDVIWGFLVMVNISIIMLAVNWQMALCVLIVVPFLWVISLYFQRRILAAQRKSRSANSKITAAFAEGINGAKTTKTLGIEEQNYAEFQKKTADMKHFSMKALRINAIFQPIVYLLSAIVIALLLAIGGQQVFLKTIQFGTLAMFVNYAQLFFDPLKQIARTLAELQLAQASAERVVSLLEEEITIQDRPEVVERYGTLLDEKREHFEPFHGQVTFSHVSFAYQKEDMVLQDFQVTAKPGEMIALVGETGSGKSTIINLLCRFYEPSSGTIYFDGKPIQDRSVGWLHSQIGYVLQTPALFSGSVLENIRYGRPDATREEVEHVAKLIHAHEFIMRLEKGYDSEVGEGGDRLSTGQKQLLSFARALLADPAIVILDEATSSIDTESERLIQLAMEELLKGRTSFVVAHRLSTIVHADQILVLRHGRVIEQGTHVSLMKEKGYYYELFTSQQLNQRIT